MLLDRLTIVALLGLRFHDAIPATPLAMVWSAGFA
jgi:hypothetical protein